MDIIARYKKYMRNRSGCKYIKLIYNHPGNLSNSDYYNMINGSDNLFFVIAIGDSQVLYYWKKSRKIDGLNLIVNSCTDDCEYIIEYDTLKKTQLMVQKVCIYNDIKRKSIQTGVFIKGECQQLPEPFTYDELKLTSFPDTIKESNTSIHLNSNDLFRMEAMPDDGILNTMTISRNGSVLNVGGMTTKFDCKFYVFKAFN